MVRLEGKRLGIVVAAIVVVIAGVVAVVLVATASTSPVDDTKAGGTLTGDRLHAVFGHLFDGVRTVHVTYSAGTAQPEASADVVVGPPVQAKITLRSASTPPQVGTVIIKDNKAYLNQPTFGAKWILMSSADDGVSGAPAFGQTAFELLYLGPHTIATYQGPATVGGISTRQYVLSASTSTATPSTATASQTVATVWIDSSGRLIQYTYSPTGDGTWVTATYSNWGEQVTVQAPPANLVNVLQGAM